MHIAIAGAGIGGLALARLLADKGHRISLFDQFDTPRPVGSGLMIQPVGLAVLDACGAGEAARAMGQRITRMLGVEAASGRRVLDVTYDRKGRAEAQGLAIHRASLHAALLAAAEAAGIGIVPASTITGAQLIGQQRALTFADGRTMGPFDLVVDATGAGSRLSPLRARPLPYGAVWGTVPWPADTKLPQDRLSQCYRRADRMAGVLPLGLVPGRQGMQAAIFWSLPADGIARWQTSPLEEWKAEATALWPEVTPFLSEITETSQMTPARYSHGNLRRPFAPALAFIGDAAHRASPQLGQGANMALLDAYALAHALARTPLDEALPLYAAMRRWHVRLYQGLSAAFTPQYQSNSRLLPILRDYALAPLSFTPPLPAILSRLVAGRLIPPLASTIFPPTPPKTPT